MAKHSHEWLTQMFVFPRDGVEGETYEHDEPYEVLYCADRECGQRKTRLVSHDVAQEVRAQHGFPTDEVAGGGE